VAQMIQGAHQFEGVSQVFDRGRHGGSFG
jgi:hypothetical protein